MRILHAVLSDQVAGVERYVARLGRAQALAGHEVLVVGGPPDAVLAGPPPGGDGTLEHRRATSVPSLAAELRGRAGQADVVHVHMTAAEVAASVTLGTRTGRPPVVSTRHFARRRGHGTAGPLVAAVARRVVDAQIAISDHVAAAVDGPCTVVRSGVDDRPDGLGAHGRDRTVLLVQRLQPEKRGDVAVEAFARSGLADAGWRLLVVGDGAERGRLEALGVSRGLGGDVRFLGVRDDVPALMRTAGVLVAPCPVEGLGLSVLEAMASGLPVVAAAAGGHLELLDGIDPACLAPPADVAATATSLRVLASDPDRRDAAAARAVTRQRTRFTLASQVAGTLDVYERALRRGRRTPA